MLKNNEIIEIKYFTAPVKGSISHPNKRINQRTYNNALLKQSTNTSIIEGYYVEKKKTVKNLNPPPLLMNTIVKEEKGTDVNIAVEIVKDSLIQDFDCVVLLSNDSDLTRSLEIAKNDGKKLITVITPISESDKQKVFSSKRLKKASDFLFSYISNNVLKKSQFPVEVSGIKKPKDWC